VELALSEPDGVVKRYERIEANVERRRRRTRTQFAISIVKNLGELGGHVQGRVA
jgi:hypothetical protein